MSSLQFTPEQIALRSGGVGSSEIAAVAGLCPFADAHTVWRRKLGLEPPQGDTLDTLYGKAFQGGVALLYEYHTSRTVRPCTETIVHPKYPIVRATPDGIVDGDRVIEIKCPRFMDGWGDEGTHDFPRHILPQVMWEMAVTGLDKADVVAKGFRDIVIYPDVLFDADLFGELRETAEKFWRDHVLTGLPPKPGHAEATREWYSKQYPVHQSEQLSEDNSADTAELVRQYEAAKATIKDAEKIKDAAQNQLIAKIGHAGGIEGYWGRVTYKAQKGRKNTNWPAIAAAAAVPQTIIDAHTTYGADYRVMRVKEGK